MGHAEPVTGISFSLYGKLFYTRSAEKTVRGWIADTGEEFRVPWEFADAVSMFVGGPTGRWIVLGGGGTGNAGREMVRWDPANGEEIASRESCDADLLDFIIATVNLAPIQSQQINTMTGLIDGLAQTLGDVMENLPESYQSQPNVERAVEICRKITQSLAARRRA